MFLDAPRGFRDTAKILERREMWNDEPRVQPLREYAEALTQRRAKLDAEALVPLFDPVESGTEARVLVLLEAPGPKAADTGGRPGSGFISVDNDDMTAANVWNMRNDVGLHTRTLSWNIVPWYMGVASIKPRSADVAAGASELRRLLQLLPHLEVVLACGAFAQRGWDRHVQPHINDDLTVIRTFHPSPLAMTKPANRTDLQKAFRRAATLVGVN